MPRLRMTNKLKRSNQKPIKSHQEKVNSYLIHIAFHYENLLGFLQLTGKEQKQRKRRTTKPKPRPENGSEAEEDNENKFRCIHCLKDFAKRKNLLNHVHKNKKCSAKQKLKPYTNSNWWRRNERKIHCKFDNCNGTYSTEDSLWQHYNHIHGLYKSDPNLKRKGTKGAVCRYKPNRQKSSQSQSKGTNLIIIAISFPFTSPIFLQFHTKKRSLRNPSKNLLLRLPPH